MTDARAPAGWYPVEGGQRYWDGSQWTDHTAPTAETAAAAPAADADATTAVISAKGQNGTVTFDGDFVTISRTGAIARITIGKGDKRIPIHSITAVQWKPPGPVINGFIAFTLGGGNEGKSRFGGQSIDATRDENAVMVQKKQADDFLKLRDAIESSIAERGRPQQTQPVRQEATPLDQLKQLGELHAAGVLSDDEFAAKKAELLSRM